MLSVLRGWFETKGQRSHEGSAAASATLCICEFVFSLDPLSKYICHQRMVCDPHLGQKVLFCYF